MKSKSIFLILALIAVFLSSCDHDRIRAKGEIVNVDYSLSDYSVLKVSNAFNVYVRFSESEESIRIKANENLHDKIIVKKEDNTLVIRIKKFTSIRGNATLDAYITTKSISDFDIAGASHIYLEDEWITQNGSIELTGASEFSGAITLNSLNLDMTGASSADIYGSVDYLNADLTGSSDLRDYDFSVNRLNIELTGASDANLSINESIDIKATGASTLSYKGAAVIDRQELTGSSEIKNKN